MASTINRDRQAVIGNCTAQGRNHVAPVQCRTAPRHAALPTPPPEKGGYRSRQGKLHPSLLQNFDVYGHDDSPATASEVGAISVRNPFLVRYQENCLFRNCSKCKNTASIL
jgi:hypothetical protein